MVILGTLEWKATRLSPTRPSTFLTHNSVSTKLVQVGSEVVQSEHRGEQIIRYLNNIRITNIRIRIRPQIETRILFIFAFVQKFGSEYYSYWSLSFSEAQQSLYLYIVFNHFWEAKYSIIIGKQNNIHIRIGPQIETRILFVFVQKFWSEYYSYSYSSKNLGPNIIRIRIRPKIWVRILSVFVFISF